MIRAAREDDLGLLEYAAFNHGQDLPGTLRWEQPFALFESRLNNINSVLDCSADSAGLRERLLQLYPHTLYRHTNPLDGARFAPPVGVPDNAFDRAICLDTLWRLDGAQRARLIAEMARKLRPGGLLVLTSRLSPEPPGGADAVTASELIETCSRHGLHPLAGEAETQAGDSAASDSDGAAGELGCVGGVFYKGRRELPPGKRIVLGMLSWHARDLTLDSLRAFVAEARMLRRLGQESFICVCDNGSTDGTQEALAAAAAKMDVPHRFILNRENVGTTRARNQIIDYMRECDGDYLLLTDSDIEIVPFSVFAMFRHMENSGCLLGSLGAYFGESHQTADRTEAAEYLYSVRRVYQADNTISSTWYGMFRRELFDEGVRFEESGPFGGPGWGVEDHDLAFQIVARGYKIRFFADMVHLHRSPHSSIGTLYEKRLDAQELYNRRKQFVLDKWTGVPGIDTETLDIIRGCTLPDSDQAA